ncbi:MAG: putative ABC transporter ATP-binding protein [Methanocella sp. PtaU1.Bin125]|nr:MAG: putative ABC transporter ATP-binding protein [Methanocella sp. PtaU1.Bin125]
MITDERPGENRPLVEVYSLKVVFPTDDGIVRAIDTMDLSIREGEKLGLIGESGCGKTVFGHAIMRLLEDTTKVTGNIVFRGKALYSLDRESMRRLRGKEIGMILQNPGASLNPVLTVGSQVSEVLVLHKGLKKRTAWDRVVGLLGRVRIPEPERRAGEYPHQFSGGMKERAVIAMGIASEPVMIIADEPTKGLDVTVKRKIVRLLKEVTVEKTMLIITHDLDVAEEVCDRIAVMYAGELVEIAPRGAMFERQLHPYVQGFFQSLPDRGLKPIPGMSPSLIHLPEGCRFHPRCNRATGRCRTEHPEMIDTGDGRCVRCFLYA